MERYVGLRRSASSGVVVLDLQHAHVGDGCTPATHEVIGDHRYVGLVSERVSDSIFPLLFFLLVTCT